MIKKKFNTLNHLKSPPFLNRAFSFPLFNEILLVILVEWSLGDSFLVPIEIHVRPMEDLKKYLSICNNCATTGPMRPVEWNKNQLYYIKIRLDYTLSVFNLLDILCSQSIPYNNCQLHAIYKPYIIVF